MKQIQSFIVYFLLTWFWFSAQAQNNLSAYEYWFNNSYDEMQTFSINSAQQHYFIENIDVAALPDGINILNIRYKDEKGLYSSTLSKGFFKISGIQEFSKNFTSYELWFNNDYESRQSNVVPSSPDHHLITEVNVTDLPGGVNVLNIRYKNENSLYSSTLSKVFYKIKEAEPVNKSLVAYELWFNNDFENRQANTITEGKSHQVFTEVNVSTLPEGVNVLNIRYKDEQGFYSSTLCKTFYKTEEDILTETYIRGYMYWFDDDYENAVVVHLQTPAKQFSISENVDVTQIAQGTHDLHFQFLDSEGRWSVVYSDTFNIPVLAVNDPPFVIHPPGNLDIQTGEVFKMYFSPYPGVLFDDADDDLLHLTLTAVGEEVLPGWLSFSNDTLTAYPAAGDAGCINLLLTATDAAGSFADTPFMLCVNPAVGTDLLFSGRILAYPNPTQGKLFVEIMHLQNPNIDIEVCNSLGMVVLQRKIADAGRLEIDLSNHSSGIYFLKAIGSNFTFTQLIVLKGK